MAEYTLGGKGGLKLKQVADTGLKKKKKKNRDAKKILEQVTKSSQTVEESPEVDRAEQQKKVIIQKTDAQIAFEKMQEKRRMQKILERASKTHKQRVEEFNRHLDNLTEHYDIPKVSWTK